MAAVDVAIIDGITTFLMFYIHLTYVGVWLGRRVRNNK